MGPRGWEETVVDGEPFYQYYVNKHSQPRPRYPTGLDGQKVLCGEGTHTRPSVRAKDNVQKDTSVQKNDEAPPPNNPPPPQPKPQPSPKATKISAPRGVPPRLLRDHLRLRDALRTHRF